MKQNDLWLALSSESVTTTRRQGNELHADRLWVRRLTAEDEAGQRAYQQLRARIFAEQFGWDVQVDEHGCERDRYDERTDEAIQIYGVFQRDQNEHDQLLGGVRIFTFQTWQESMVMNEFAVAGLLPPGVLNQLEHHHQMQHVLELTRLCLVRGQSHQTSVSQRVLARDLLYAAVYQQAERTGRYQVLALASAGVFQVFERAHFALQILYAHRQTTRHGHVLMMIDLRATIQQMCAAGEWARAERMLALCQERSWIT